MGLHPCASLLPAEPPPLISSFHTLELLYLWSAIHFFYSKPQEGSSVVTLELAGLMLTTPPLPLTTVNVSQQFYTHRNTGNWLVMQQKDTCHERTLFGETLAVPHRVFSWWPANTITRCMYLPHFPCFADKGEEQYDSIVGHSWENGMPASYAMCQ
jgi:hypothetical protein